MALELRTRKVTRKLVEELAGKTYALNNHIYRHYEKISRTAPLDNMFHVRSLIKSGALGKPLVHMAEYESNPGVWILEDTDSDDYVILFSDVHRTNAFKGTSIESSTRNDTMIAKIVDFFESFDSVS